MRNLINIEAEQAVIGSLLKFPSCADKVLDVLTPEDFTDWRHQEILSAVSSFYADGRAFDAVTICDAVQSQEVPWYAIELVNEATSPANIKSYVTIVKDRAKFRAFSSAAAQISTLVNDAETYEEAISEAQSTLINLETMGSSVGDPQCSTTVVARVIQDLDRRFRSDGAIDGLETGFIDVDNRWLGMKAGQLIVIAGRPSMGKSAYGMQIVQHNGINKGKNCLVFSLEMTSDELTERMIASSGHIPYGLIRKAECFGDYSSQLSNAVGSIKKADINYIDNGGLHINQVCGIARKWHRRKPLDLIMVDHINIMRGDGQSREREVADITGKLKALAKELKIPVVALAQLNRGVESRTDKRPMMSDLRDSGSIEQDADIVQMLYRDDYYSKAEGESTTGREGMVDLFTRKFRGGEVGDDVLTNNLAMMRMENLTSKVLSWEELEAQRDEKQKNKKPKFQYD